MKSGWRVFRLDRFGPDNYFRQSHVARPDGLPKLSRSFGETLWPFGTFAPSTTGLAWHQPVPYVDNQSEVRGQVLLGRAGSEDRGQVSTLLDYSPVRNIGDRRRLEK